MGTHISSPGGGGSGGGGGTDTDVLPSTTTPTTQAFGDPPSLGADTTHFALGDHEHGLPAAPAGGGGASPWRIEVNCVLGMAPVDAVAGAGAWTVQGDTGELTGFVLSQNGTGDLDDYIAYDLLLSAGTWGFEAICQTGVGVGVIHFEADDGDGVFTDYGNVDGYTGSSVVNQRLHIPGMVIVGAANLRRVRLKMASKNAAASGYGLNITAFTLQRTA